MKKIMIRAFACSCAAAMLSMSAFAAPIDSVRQNNVKKQIVISGNTGAASAGKRVTVAFLTKEKSALDDPAFGDFVYLKQLSLDANGGYETAFAMDGGSGEYVARVYIEGENAPAETAFQFYSFAEAEEYLAQINDADAAGVKTLLESKKAEIGIDTELYRAMLAHGVNMDAVYQKIATHADFATLADFILYFEQELPVAAGGSGVAEIAELLVAENLDDWQDTVAYGFFTAMPESEQKTVYEKMSGIPGGSGSELRAAFVQAVLLAQVQEGSWQQVMRILQGELDPELGLNLNNFERYPGEVAKAIAGESYFGIAQLQSAINAVTGEENSGNGTGSGGSGGGRGGSGGGSGGFTADPKPQDTQPEEPVDNSFHDLSGYEWAQESIHALAEKGIINGVAPNQFDPGAQVTREEFITMLVRAFPMEYSGNPADFSDVPSGSWYESPVAAAQENGIINGIGEGFFGVGRAITREELAKMAYYTLQQICGITSGGDIGQFGDNAEIAEYARESVGAMAELGIINGYEDGTFRPRGNATRAEAAKIIYGMLRQTGGI